MNRESKMQEIQPLNDPVKKPETPNTTDPTAPEGLPDPPPDRYPVTDPLPGAPTTEPDQVPTQGAHPR